MSNAGRATPMKVGPLDIPPIPSTISIDLKKFPFLKKAKPGDGIKISVSATVESVHLDEHEERLRADIQDLIPQPKEEKQEATDGIVPK